MTTRMMKPLTLLFLTALSLQFTACDAIDDLMGKGGGDKDEDEEDENDDESDDGEDSENAATTLAENCTSLVEKIHEWDTSGALPLTEEDRFFYQMRCEGVQDEKWTSLAACWGVDSKEDYVACNLTRPTSKELIDKRVDEACVDAGDEVEACREEVTQGFEEMGRLRAEKIMLPGIRCELAPTNAEIVDCFVDLERDFFRREYDTRLSPEQLDEYRSNYTEDFERYDLEKIQRSDAVTAMEEAAEAEAAAVRAAAEAEAAALEAEAAAAEAEAEADDDEADDTGSPEPAAYEEAPDPATETAPAAPSSETSASSTESSSAPVKKSSRPATRGSNPAMKPGARPRPPVRKK